jgi:hypothetical protein
MIFKKIYNKHYQNYKMNLVTNPQWNHLWKLKIPPKQANLLWRIFQNVLP